MEDDETYYLLAPSLAFKEIFVDFSSNVLEFDSIAIEITRSANFLRSDYGRMRKKTSLQFNFDSSYCIDLLDMQDPETCKLPIKGITFNLAIRSKSKGIILDFPIVFKDVNFGQNEVQLPIRPEITKQYGCIFVVVDLCGVLKTNPSSVVFNDVQYFGKSASDSASGQLWLPSKRDPIGCTKWEVNGVMGIEKNGRLYGGIESIFTKSSRLPEGRIVSVLVSSVCIGDSGENSLTTLREKRSYAEKLEIKLFIEGCFGHRSFVRVHSGERILFDQPTEEAIPDLTQRCIRKFRTYVLIARKLSYHDIIDVSLITSIPSTTLSNTEECPAAEIKMIRAVLTVEKEIGFQVSTAIRNQTLEATMKLKARDSGDFCPVYVEPLQSMTGSSWFTRQLHSFQRFHRHCAAFIHHTYGEACSMEYRRRVQAQACSICRERSENNSQSIAEWFEHFPTSDEDHRPYYCLANDCAMPNLFNFRNANYLERLFFGLVGDMAGWVLAKSKYKPDAAWRKERERGMNQKRLHWEFSVRKALYDQAWVEKWACPSCGKDKPFSFDEEERLEEARAKRLSVMFGELEKFDSPEETGPINWTLFKVSKDQYCLTCRCEYKPRIVWRKKQWEQRQLEFEHRRLRHLESIQQSLEKERQSREQEEFYRLGKHFRRNDYGRRTSLARATVDAVFSKSCSIGNDGGLLWERLNDLSFSLLPSNPVFGKNVMIETAVDNSDVVTASEWNIPLSSKNLCFSIDEATKSFSVAQRNKNKIEFEGLCTAIVDLSQVHVNTAAKIEEYQLKSGIPQITGEKLVNSYISSVDAGSVTATTSLPTFVEVIFMVSENSHESGAFSLGLRYQDTIESEAGHFVALRELFGKERFSWGICEMVPQSGFADARNVSSLWERGVKVCDFRCLQEGDCVQLLLDPIQGRLSFTIIRGSFLVGAGDQVPSKVELQHTFLVPVGRLRHYQIGCTMNERQCVVLCPSEGEVKRFEEERKKLDMLLMHDMKRSLVPSNLPNCSRFQPPCGRGDVKEFQIDEIDFKEKMKRLHGTSNDKIVRSMENEESGPEDEKEVVEAMTDARRNTVPKVVTETLFSDDSSAVRLTQSDLMRRRETRQMMYAAALREHHATSQKQIVDYGSMVIDWSNCSDLIRLRRSKRKSVKSNRQREFERHKLDLMRRADAACFSSPLLVDVTSSEATWLIGIPGAPPRDALATGHINNDINTLKNYDFRHVLKSDFHKDDCRVFTVRMKHSRDDGCQHWGVGCLVDDPSARSEVIWIDKRENHCNLSLILRSSEIASSERIQYLLDTNPSRYCWFRGSAEVRSSTSQDEVHGRFVKMGELPDGCIHHFAHHSPSPFNRMQSERTSPANSKSPQSNSFGTDILYFLLPVKAVCATSELIDGRLTEQYIVRTEIDGNIWPGVYFHCVEDGEDFDDSCWIDPELPIFPPSWERKDQQPSTETSSDASPPLSPLQMSGSSFQHHYGFSPPVGNKESRCSRVDVSMKGQRLAASNAMTALFPYIGRIVKVHLSEVEFLCRM